MQKTINQEGFYKKGNCTTICFSVLLTAILSIILGSCYRDLGNYDYVPRNPMTFINLKEEYILLSGQKFSLDIQVKTQDGSSVTDTNRYSYRWTATNPNTNASALQISSKLFFDTIPNLPAGKSTVLLQIVDKVSGSYIFGKTTFNVSSLTREGLFILSSLEDNALLQMVHFDGDKQVLYPDILKHTGVDFSLDGKGAPYAINTNLAHQIVVTTDQETYSFYHNPSNQLLKDEKNDLAQWFLNLGPSDIQAQYIKTGQFKNYHYLFANNNLYYAATGGRFLLYGPKVNRYSASSPTFAIAPFAGSLVYEGGMLFNMDEGCFLYHSPYAPAGLTEIVYPTPIRNVLDGAGQVYTLPTNLELISMRTLDFFSTVYLFDALYPTSAVVKEKSTGRYLYLRFTFDSRNERRIILQTRDLVISAPDFDKASHVDIDPTFGYVYYSVGDKLYQYDYGRNFTTMVADMQGKEITMVRFPKFSNIVDDDRIANYSKEVMKRGKRLLVATYDPTQPTGTGGILHAYQVKPLGEGLEYEWKVGGLAKAMDAIQLDVY